MRCGALQLGGYFSIKRNIMSIPAGVALTQEQVLPFTEALLRVFRDHGPRGDRQQTRLMWLVEALGVEKFVGLIGEYMGGAKFAPAVHVSGAAGQREGGGPCRPALWGAQ